MSVEADGSCTVHRTRIVKARKKHSCVACRETIRKGDRYRYTFQVFDGDSSSFRHCLRCNAMISAIDREQTDPDHTTDAELNCGHTWEDVFEEPPPEEVARLAFMSRDDAQKAFGAKP